LFVLRYTERVGHLEVATAADAAAASLGTKRQLREVGRHTWPLEKRSGSLHARTHARAHSRGWPHLPARAQPDASRVLCQVLAVRSALKREAREASVTVGTGEVEVGSRPSHAP
jgi:hypothetical protein